MMTELEKAEIEGRFMLLEELVAEQAQRIRELEALQKPSIFALVRDFRKHK